MNRPLSKKAAIKLIADARAAGLRREVEVLKVGDHRIAVQVTLSGVVQKGRLYAYSHVHLSFRTNGRKSSVSVSSRSDYQTESTRGAWSAGYALEYLKQTAASAGVAISQN